MALTEVEADSSESPGPGRPSVRQRLQGWRNQLGQRTDPPPEAEAPTEEADAPPPEDPPVVRVVTVKLPLQHWDWAPDADSRPIVAGPPGGVTTIGHPRL